MLGDLRKPNIEFTSDIVYITHNTRIVKKVKTKAQCVESRSLLELRKKERQRNKFKDQVKKITTLNEDDLSGSDSINSE